MKPIEILEGKFDVDIRSGLNSSFLRNFEKDCIVAYANFLGLLYVFVLKVPTGLRTYLITKNARHCKYFGSEIGHSKAYKYIKNIREKKIIDRKEYKKFKRIAMVDLL